MLKKALIVGINAYPGAPLRGCHNDVERMRELLISRFGFPAEEMRILRDAEATASGIKAGLEWLAEGDEENAVRLFHFSGHGKYVPDENGDEPDGRDEAIVPYDYQTAGFITDDTLRLLYDQCPPTSNLTLVMDCCHSGTNDRVETNEAYLVYRGLPTTYDEFMAIDAARERYEEDRREYIRRALRRFRVLPEGERFKIEADLGRRFEIRRARLGDVSRREFNVLMAAARPDQTAADARIAGDYHGAFTYYLVEAIRQTSGTPTYHEVMTAVARSLERNRYSQVPQLECRAENRNRPLFSPF